MKLVKKEPVADGKIVVTIVGDWNDRDRITETTSRLLEHQARLLQRVIVLQDFYGSRKELEKLYKEYGFLDIRTDCSKAAETYLIRKYGFDEQEVFSKDVADDFWDEIYALAPSYEGYSIHTVTSVSIRIDGEEYEVEWEPSEVRGIIADLFELES
jgi:hypothetical protein